MSKKWWNSKWFIYFKANDKLYAVEDVEWYRAKQKLKWYDEQDLKDHVFVRGHWVPLNCETCLAYMIMSQKLSVIEFTPNPPESCITKDNDYIVIN